MGSINSIQRKRFPTPTSRALRSPDVHTVPRIFIHDELYRNAPTTTATAETAPNNALHPPTINMIPPLLNAVGDRITEDSVAFPAPAPVPFHPPETGYGEPGFKGPTDGEALTSVAVEVVVPGSEAVALLEPGTGKVPWGE